MEQSIISNISTASTRADPYPLERSSFKYLFNEGFTFNDFQNAVIDAGNTITRIIETKIINLSILCSVRSISGSTVWHFDVDFNDWGHFTRKYWINSENSHSDIPDSFAKMIMNTLSALKVNQNSLFRFTPSYYVEYFHHQLPSSRDLFINSVSEAITSVVSKDKQYPITIKDSDKDFIDEHVYVVESMFRSFGFLNVRTEPLPVYTPASEVRLYSVYCITIDGKPAFDAHTSFKRSAEVVIYYHDKKTLKFPYTKLALINKNVFTVKNELSSLGFTNVVCSPTFDVRFKLFHKNESIAHVRIENDPLYYDSLPYDTRITLEYYLH